METFKQAEEKCYYQLPEEEKVFFINRRNAWNSIV
jgi:hypothetical protein